MWYIFNLTNKIKIREFVGKNLFNLIRSNIILIKKNLMLSCFIKNMVSFSLNLLSSTLFIILKTTHTDIYIYIYKINNDG